jgi:hypothetical protein
MTDLFEPSDEDEDEDEFDDDGDEEEFDAVDGEGFDGGYGFGSYFHHAMTKDD